MFAYGTWAEYLDGLVKFTLAPSRIDVLVVEVIERLPTLGLKPAVLLPPPEKASKLRVSCV